MRKSPLRKVYQIRIGEKMSQAEQYASELKSEVTVKSEMEKLHKQINKIS